MTFRLGLTGSIGMGKSTTAKMFADLGCAVWDADDSVARLYVKNGAAVVPLSKVLPAVIRDGAVNRESLRAAIREDVNTLKILEEIVHPLVRQDRENFASTTTADIAVFDIPLLFETGAEAEFDATACVSVSKATQRARVLARGTMTEEDFEIILAKQMPNDEKCARADYVIETEELDAARTRVSEIVREIREKQNA